MELYLISYDYCNKNDWSLKETDRVLPHRAEQKLLIFLSNEPTLAILTYKVVLKSRKPVNSGLKLKTADSKNWRILEWVTKWNIWSSYGLLFTCPWFRKPAERKFSSIYKNNGGPWNSKNLISNLPTHASRSSGVTNSNAQSALKFLLVVFKVR